MNTTKVKKQTLIDILAKNRSEHRDIFLAAQSRYREVVIAALDEQLKAARDEKPFQLVKISALVQPEDHTDDYDRVLRMLELTEDTVIELHASEFECYVQDNWGWVGSWSASNSNYTSSPKFRK